MSDLVSIIVRVYNVKPYLVQCLNSLKQQTYKDLQILIVDDGSTDGCSEICDEYAVKDSRFEVYHLKNGGQATARNYALERTRGQWVGFVDGDDWIAAEMVEQMLMAAREADADMAVCGVVYAYRDGHRDIPVTSEYKILENKDASMEVCFGGNQLRQNIWNKLVRRKCIEEQIPPEWQSHQDMVFLTRFLLNVNRIVLLDRNLYYYRQQVNSTVHVFTMRNSYNRWRSILEKYRLVSAEFPKYRAVLVKECFWAAVLMWRDTDLNPGKRKQYQRIFSEVSQFAREHYHEMRGSLMERASAWCVQFDRQWSFALIHFVFWVKRKAGRSNDRRFQLFD